MQALAKDAQIILEALVSGLAPGESRKIHNDESFMAVHVERLASDRWSVSHYYIQNGDMCPDPDMEFWQSASGSFFPVSFQDSGLFGRYDRAVYFGDDGKVTGYRKAALTRQRIFAGIWMRNIKAQQGPVFVAAQEVAA